MSETFRKISNIKFNGKQLYYKTNHISVMVPVTEFTNTSHILYFYKMHNFGRGMWRREL